MASGAYTNGKWEAAGLHAQGLYANDGSCAILARQADGESTIVCTVNLQSKVKRGEAYRTKCAERDANLALIAAAPDLLAALKQIVELIDVPGQVLVADGRAAANIARAALSKAGAQ